MPQIQALGQNTKLYKPHGWEDEKVLIHSINEQDLDGNDPGSEADVEHKRHRLRELGQL